MELKPGLRLSGVADTTEVVVIRATGANLDLRCGGYPMVPTKSSCVATLDANWSGGTVVGKRYANEEMGLEVLCTKAGDGSLAVGPDPLHMKEAKPLPSSD